MKQKKKSFLRQQQQRQVEKQTIESLIQYRLCV